MEFRPIEINAIRIGHRYRKDMGDIDSLAQSISDVGLLNPITVTSDLRLIAGDRRLEACKRLGKKSIMAHIAGDLDDAVPSVRAELDENACRKAMLPSELAALAGRLWELERPKAEQRQQDAGSTWGKSHPKVVRPDEQAMDSDDHRGRRTNAVVAEALGVSASHVSELRSVYRVAADTELPDHERKLARDALAEMDHGRGVKTVAREFLRRLKEERSGIDQYPDSEFDAEPEEAVSSIGDGWIPAPSDKTRMAAKRRREVIKEMAQRGSTSKQIGETLGVLARTVSAIAKASNINIPANDLLRGTHKTIDSNQIVSRIVDDLSDMELSLALIEYDQLDSDLIDEWTERLTEAIRNLNHLKRKLKEI